MQRVTITIDNQLYDEIEKLAQARGYQNRSEIVRDLVRAGISETKDDHPSGECIASVVYVYDQKTRDLPQRLAHAFQQAHDLSVATMRISLDHESCMEVAVLRGKSKAVQQLANAIISERGTRHGRITMIPATIEKTGHKHGDRRTHAHEHIRVR
ncbi:MAG: nickel-responsive transcriptional regulator NikR [Rhizobiales bacterium]|nr:nickel-responsive transcriptional regulator NikR [Hyphomicrobiales bacterium]